MKFKRNDGWILLFRSYQLIAANKTRNETKQKKKKKKKLDSKHMPFEITDEIVKIQQKSNVENVSSFKLHSIE